ncbi:MAG: hypothetical protein IPP79_16355 [Chitinophagaceae bacterium]|nr:hypothetical protein [Chitinophagaceae bacterium]
MYRTYRFKYLTICTSLYLETGTVIFLSRTPIELNTSGFLIAVKFTNLTGTRALVVALFLAGFVIRNCELALMRLNSKLRNDMWYLVIDQ